MRRNDAVLGYAGLRVAMGMAMLMHGIVRLGHVAKFVENMVKMFAGSPLPAQSVLVFAWVNAPVELLIGGLVLLGLATRFGPILGMLWMTLLIFGSSLIENYNAVAIQLLYSLIFYHLLTNAGRNVLSLDHLFSRKSVFL